MKDLDKNKVYDLSKLTNGELISVWNYLMENDEDWIDCPFEEVIRHQKTYYLCFIGHNWGWDNTMKKETHNAKELFYTLENVQVDCSDETEERIKEMADVYKNNGFNIGSLYLSDDYCFLNGNNCNYCLVNKSLKNKTTITYDKFMELFAQKYEVKYIVDSAKKVLNPQPHYNNKNGSLYKIANDLGLNHWEFDIFKRLVRCRKKNQFKEDLQKIKDTIDIYLNENL